MIELTNIVKSFSVGDSVQTILKGIDLNIQNQEFVSIMGPSGSGKTTLAAILGCLSSPTSGNYKLDGTEVSEIRAKDLAKFRNQRIGFVFQDFNLLDGVNAVENVSLPLVYSGMSAVERKRLATEALERVGLGHRLTHKPKQLSGGQKQRVAIARAIVTKPTLLFADEPTGALDSVTTREILELMQQLNADGQTVVQVTHSEEDARYSKRIIRIDDGQIVKDELVTNFDSGRIADDEADEKSERQRAIWNLISCSETLDEENNLELKKLSKRTNGIAAKMAAAKALLNQNNLQGRSQLRRLYLKNDWRVRAEILRNLDFWKNDTAYGFLTMGLTDAFGWIRYLALDRLMQVGHEIQKVCIGDHLEQLLNDDDERVRATLVTVIKGWNLPDYFEAMQKRFEVEPNARVRANILEAALAYVRARGELPFEPAGLRHTLKDQGHRVKTTAAVLLWKEYTDEAKQAIWTCLESTRSVERSAAIWAVTEIQDKELAIDALDKIMDGKIDAVIERQLVQCFKSLEQAGVLRATDIMGLAGIERVEAQLENLNSVS